MTEFFNRLSQTNTIRQAVGILAVTTFIGSILGLVRNFVIADQVGKAYGSLGPLDSYFAAFILPDIVFTVLIMGALNSAILPLLVRLDSEKDNDRFWLVYNRLVSNGLVAVSIFLIGILLTLPILIPFLFSGFTDSQIALTITLSQVLVLSPLFFTVSQIASSALQAKRTFLASALAPIIYNLAIIAGAFLVPEFGLRGLVLGVIFGAVSHFLIQVPSLIKLGWRFQFILDFKSQEIKQVVRLMIPRAIALTGAQLLILGFYRLASDFQEGAIATYKLMSDLQLAPILLLANSLAVAIFPELTRRLIDNNRENFQRLVGQSLRFLVYALLPLSIFLIIFRSEITKIYLGGSGNLTLEKLDLAAATLAAFVVSLVFQGAVAVLARAYFAHGDTVRPTIVSIGSIVLAFVTALVLTEFSDLGVVGLALAFSLGSTVNALVLVALLKIPLSEICLDSAKRPNLLAVILLSIAVGCIAWGVREVMPKIYSLLFLATDLQGAINILTGALFSATFYLMMTKILRLEQWQLIRKTRSIAR